MPKSMCNLLSNAFLPSMLGPAIGLGLMCSQPRKVEFHGQKKPMRPWRSFSGLDLVSHEAVLFECLCVFATSIIWKVIPPLPGRFADIFGGTRKSEACQREVGGGQ